MDRRKLLLAGGGLTAAALGGAAIERHRLGSMDDYDAFVAAIRQPLRSAPDRADLIRYATLAPSGHNTQPWRFRIDAAGIAILPDPARRTPVVDPDDHHLFVALGCSAENLRLRGRRWRPLRRGRVRPGGRGILVPRLR